MICDLLLMFVNLNVCIFFTFIQGLSFHFIFLNLFNIRICIAYMSKISNDTMVQFVTYRFFYLKI